jgi:hypothetical protein
MLFAILSFWAVVGYVRPHFDSVHSAAREAGRVAERFVAALKEGDFRSAHGFLSDRLRASLPAPAFAERIQKSREGAPRYWKDLRVIRTVPGTGLRDGLAWIHGSMIHLENAGGWRISGIDHFLKNIPGRD